MHIYTHGLLHTDSYYTLGRGEVCKKSREIYTNVKVSEILQTDRADMNPNHEHFSLYKIRICVGVGEGSHFGLAVIVPMPLLQCCKNIQCNQYYFTYTRLILARCHFHYIIKTEIQQFFFLSWGLFCLQQRLSYFCHFQLTQKLQ